MPPDTSFPYSIPKKTHSPEGRHSPLPCRCHPWLMGRVGEGLGDVTVTVTLCCCCPAGPADIGGRGQPRGCDSPPRPAPQECLSCVPWDGDTAELPQLQPFLVTSGEGSGPFSCLSLSCCGAWQSWDVCHHVTATYCCLFPPGELC